MKTEARFGGRGSVYRYRHPLLQAISASLKALEALEDPAARCWPPAMAAAAAVLMAVEATKPLTVRWESVRACLDPAQTGRCGASYNGLVKALLRQQDLVLPTLRQHLQAQVQAAWADLPRVHGWLVLAVDGSKEELPRTASNEQRFGIADNGQCPQALVSGIVEVHTGLLWDYRLDQGTGSEKGHLMAMAAGLPQEALLVADANYVGYGVWASLDQAGKSFLIRVGGNVRLLTGLLTGLFPEADLQQEGRIVYAWPKDKQGTCRPLVLRLIRVGSRRRRVWLLTNVLDPVLLSRKAAGEIYRRRWGAELFYRGFKRTLGFFKLRSHTGQRTRNELEWALICATILSLTGLSALTQAGQDPVRLSLARLIHTFRGLLGPVAAGSSTAACKALQQRLAGCLKDTYVRHRPKRSRHRPRTRNTPKTHRLKPPRRRRATAQERQRAQQLWPQLAA